LFHGSVFENGQGREFRRTLKAVCRYQQTHKAGSQALFNEEKYTRRVADKTSASILRIERGVCPPLIVNGFIPHTSSNSTSTLNRLTDYTKTLIEAGFEMTKADDSRSN
jgi:hypothetical protein